MTTRPAPAFACAHMTDERLYAHRLQRQMLIDTTAVADHAARRQGRLKDIATVQQGGIEAMAARVPGSQLTVIEDCGHLSTIEQPAAVTDALARWLETTA